jgi:hypothetical protein
MVKKVGAVFLLLLIGAGMIALGGSDSATTTVSWTVLPFASLSVVGDGKSGESLNSIFTIPQPNVEELEQGWLERRRAITLMASSNVDWEVTVRTDARNLGKSCAGSYIKPLEDFKLRAKNGEYQNIGNRPLVLTTGGMGSNIVEVDYRIDLDRELYEPGDYQLTLIYTIVTD